MKIRLSGNNIYKSLCLAWAILCISIFIYYPGKISYLQGSFLENWPDLFHKFSRIDFLNYISDLLTAFIGITIYSVASVSVGSFLLKSLRQEIDQEPLSGTTCLALLGTAYLIGQGFLSVTFLTLGELHQLTPFYVALVVTGALITGAYPLLSFLSKFATKNLFNKMYRKLDNTSDKILIWLTSCVLLLGLMYSSSRLGYDSVALYFSNAKITAMTNHIQFFLNDSFIVSSFQTGIHHAALIQVFGDQTARIHSWVSAVIIIIFSLALGKEVGLSRRARLLLLILIVTSTAFLDVMGDGKVDLASSAPAMAVIYWMVVSQKNTSNIIFLLMGFLAGFAIISRPHNIFLMGIVMALFYLQHTYLRKEKQEHQAYELLFKPLLLISIGIVCLLVYHLIANWVILGDPLAPLKNFQKVNSSTWPWTIDPQQIWTIRLIYPLALTFYNNPQSGGNISPAFLAFLPAIFFKDARNKIWASRDLIIVSIATSITLFLWVMLVFAIVEIRYVLFLWIILFMPLAGVIESLLESMDVLLQVITRVLLMGLLVFVALRIVYISLDTYSQVDKHGNPQCHDIDFCNVLMPVNRIASPGDRVLTLNAYRYYLRPYLFACSTTNNEYRKLQDLSHQKSDDFWTEVYREGYKYIIYEYIYSHLSLRLGITPHPDNTPNWLKLRPIYGKPGDLIVAYQIIVNNPPYSIQKSCTKNEIENWEVQSISP